MSWTNEISRDLSLRWVTGRVDTPYCTAPLGRGILVWSTSLQWHHNGLDGVSNHQPHRLFRSRSTKTSKLRVTGLCAGNSPVTGEFPAQMASNAENVSIWWRHHVLGPTYIPDSTWSLVRRVRVLNRRIYVTAPTHYLIQCWLMISKLQWHSSCGTKPLPNPMLTYHQ